ncbi:hydrogenase subunit, partial [Candidatus Woesearchaeota archaeon]|nr:hydrogenase subunit [Candidatus Woesearchaeota archaeon]
QSLFVAAIAFLLFLKEKNVILVYTALLTLISRGIFIPFIMKKVQKKINIRRDIEFHYLQSSGSIIAAIIIILLVHIVFSKILGTMGLTGLYYVGAVLGFSLTMIGMLIIFSRKKIITKIVGYLTMENGVVLFSLFISELPLLIEMFVLMDLIMLVVIAATLGMGMDSSIETFHEQLNPFRGLVRGWKK